MIKLALGAATVVFTTREGGVSPAPFDSLNLGANTEDEPQNVADNRNIVCARLDLRELYWQRQVHGTELHRYRSTSAAGSVDADAIIGSERGVGLTITTADCFPVAMASDVEVAV
ncbi:MAG: laccase domain-containing protein, partial [Thermoleophilaceae bacterium]|nr:laccase domain-containing protein [Thermoleophilaceae bacterium]